VQNYFCTVFAARNDAFGEKISGVRGKFVQPILSARARADARNAYSIDVFAICAQCARNVVDRFRFTGMCAWQSTLTVRVAGFARLIHTSLSGVSVFFIAL